MIYFQDWNIRADGGVIARQYDNLTRTLTVSGQIPDGWEWTLLVQVGKAMDILPLTASDEGLSIVLTAQQLSVSGYYSMQLRGVQGELVRHSNIISVFIPKSLSGDETWPVLPSEFTQMEQRVAKVFAEVEGYTVHPPVIGEQGDWLLWDGSQYVDSGKPSRGEVGAEDAVLYTSQTLTDEQKAQARENIGAAKEEIPITAANVITNSSFDTADKWNVVYGGTMTVADNKASVYHDGANGTVCGVQQTILRDSVPQVSGDIWFIKVHADVEPYQVPSSGDWLYPWLELYVNSESGLLYAQNVQPKKRSADYYGNIQLTTDAIAHWVLFVRAQYNKTEYVTDKTCSFSKAMMVNLTEAYGAGNEPSAEDFYKLLSTTPDCWFEGTQTLAGVEEQELFLSVSAVTNDTVVTVGAGGDYATISEALEFLSKRRVTHKNGGINYEVKILDGTIINEQIWLEKVDLSYISITTDNADNTVRVDVTGWTGVTHDTRGNRPFFSAEYGARLPCIKCLFSAIVPEGGWTNENQAVGYFCNRGSTGVIAGSVDANDVRANIGFENFYDNIIANNNSEIVAREAVARNAGRYGILSRHISRVSARSADITNCADIAAYADRASMMDVRHADLSGSKNGIAAYHASIVTANETDANSIQNIVADAQYGSTINCQAINVDGAVDVFKVTGGANIVATGAVLSNVMGMAYNVTVNMLSANGVIYS